jgi:Transmembrane secretion effector
MCSACGIPTHVLEFDEPGPVPQAARQSPAAGAAGSSGSATAASAKLLVAGGIAYLASMSITQTVVQLLAPPAERGRVVGLYGVSANGLRAGSGFTVGLLGAAVGIHVSLGISAAALCAGTVLAALYALRGRSRVSGQPDGESLAPRTGTERAA